MHLSSLLSPFQLLPSVVMFVGDCLCSHIFPLGPRSPSISLDSQPLIYLPGQKLTFNAQASSLNHVMTSAGAEKCVLIRVAQHSPPEPFRVWACCTADLPIQDTLPLCRGLVPASNKEPCGHSLARPPQWDGEEKWKKKANLRGWDKDGLTEQQRKR